LQSWLEAERNHVTLPSQQQQHQTTKARHSGGRPLLQFFQSRPKPQQTKRKQMNQSRLRFSSTTAPVANCKQSKAEGLQQTATSLNPPRHTIVVNDDHDEGDENDSMPDLDASSSDDSDPAATTITGSRSSINFDYTSTQSKHTKQAPALTTLKPLSATKRNNKTKSKSTKQPSHHRSSISNNPIINPSSEFIFNSYTTTRLPFQSQAILWIVASVLAYMLLKGIWLLLWLLQWALWVLHTTVEGGQTLLNEWIVQVVLVGVFASLEVRCVGPWFAFRIAMGETEFVVGLSRCPNAWNCMFQSSGVQGYDWV